MTAEDARRSMESHRAWLVGLMNECLDEEIKLTRQLKVRKEIYAQLSLAIAGVDRSLDALMRDPQVEVEAESLSLVRERP